MFYSFKRGTKVMAVERSAVGRERKKARDAFYPCCSLLYPRSVISHLPKPPSAPHEVLFCRAFLRQEKPVLLPSKGLLSGLKETLLSPSSQLMSRENYLFPSLAASSKILHVLMSESKKGCSTWLSW